MYVVKVVYFNIVFGIDRFFMSLFWGNRCVFFFELVKIICLMNYFLYLFYE